MTKKILLIISLCSFMSGMLHAEDTDTEEPQPKNTVTIEIGTAGYSLMISGITAIYGYPMGILNTGIQYERQLTGYLSLAGRLAYNGMLLFDDGYISALLAECHVRYYPEQDTFFLDGMLGYGNFHLEVGGWEPPMSHYFILEEIIPKTI